MRAETLERVEQAIRDGTAEAVWTLYVDESPQPLGGECVVECEQAITVDADVADYIGPRMVNAPVRCVVEIAGALFPLMSGFLQYPVYEEEAGETKVEGGSPYSYAGDIPLGPPENDPREAVDKGSAPGTIEFSGVKAENVVRNVASRLPYDPRRIDVEPSASPVMHKSGPDCYFEDTPCLQVFDEAQEHGDLLLFDTPEKGLRGIRTPGLGESGEVRWSYETALLPEDAFRATPSQKPYTEVWVYARNEDGTRRARARAKVDASRMLYPFPKPVPLWIPLAEPDESSADDALAQERADAEARRLAMGLHDFELTVPLNPLLGIGALIRVGEDVEMAIGIERTEYLCRIYTYRHAKSEQSSTFTGEAYVLSRMLSPHPLISASELGASPGVLVVPPLNAPFLHWGQTDTEFGSPSMDVPFDQLP